MRPTVTFLFFTGLCLKWATGAQKDTLPGPTLWADPSPVVPKGANVTLRCQGRLGAYRFQLWKDGVLGEERHGSQDQEDFELRDVEVERDARSYSCRYGQGNLWSELSEPLALVVMTGELPAPSLSISHEYTIQAGTPVNVSCRPSQPVFSQEYTFVLLDAESLEPLQRKSFDMNGTHFSLLHVRAEDSGRYSCIYYHKTAPFRGSLPSPSLLLTVRGDLPKPTLRVQPGPIVFPRTNITLWCSRPNISSLVEVEFSLMKSGNQEAVKAEISAELWTGFLLPSVRPEDTGSYRCAYRDSRDTARWSEYSDALELLVTGYYPRPSLSSLPGLVVRPGTHLTLKCWQPSQLSTLRMTFILLKTGTPQPLQTQSPAGSMANFPLPSVKAEDAGNYSCVYHGRTRPLQVSQPSEVLEIWVTDSQPSNVVRLWTQCNNILLFTLICVSFLLLLCLLLLAFLCHQSIPGGSSQGANSKSPYYRCLCCSCLPWGISMNPNPDVPREDALYTEVAEERPREPSVSMAEDSQGVIYAHLNIKTLDKRKRDHLKTYTEPTLYASVSMQGKKAQKL